MSENYEAWKQDLEAKVNKLKYDLILFWVEHAKECAIRRLRTTRNEADCRAAVLGKKCCFPQPIRDGQDPMQPT